VRQKGYNKDDERKGGKPTPKGCDKTKNFRRSQTALRAWLHQDIRTKEGKYSCVIFVASASLVEGGEERKTASKVEFDTLELKEVWE